jgi:hypothetical protein
MLWRDGHSEAERVRPEIPLPVVTAARRSGSEGSAERSPGQDFGDNKSRLSFLQTAEFAAIFDPH